jgi:hypothetical protein
MGGLQSVLAQSYKDFEFLILNDGSTDDIPQILNQFDDPRIRVLSFQKNRGLIHCLNLGLKLSRGEFIARMDADDVCHPRRFEKQVQAFLDAPSLAICGTSIQILSESGLGKKIIYVQSSSEIAQMLLFDCPIAHPTVMFRKSFLKKYKLRYDPNFRRVEDYRLWTQAIRHGDMMNLNQVLLQYRVHSQQVTSQINPVEFKNREKIWEDYLKHLGFVENNNLVRWHAKLLHHQIKNLSELQQAQRWMESLVEVNADQSVFDQHAFAGLTAAQWLKSCGFLALKIFGTWGCFWNSKLRKHLQWSPQNIKQLFLLLFKSLARSMQRQR